MTGKPSMARRISVESVSCAVPSAVSASRGPGSVSSMASAKNLPQNPTQSTAIASVPATGPRPTAMTKSSAQTRSGTVRQNEITARAA